MYLLTQSEIAVLEERSSAVRQAVPVLMEAHRILRQPFPTETVDTLEDLISSLQREVTTLEDFLLRAKSRPATEKGGIPA